MYQQIDSNKRKTAILMVLFVIFIIIIGYFFGELSDIGYSAVVIALIISIIMTSISYFFGDKIALTTAGAKEIKHDDSPYIYHLVENLCITAGLKTIPKIYLINDPAPNAFATGRDPEHASIALTSGLIEKLEKNELEGVIAHELSHIKNYDIRLMTVVIVLVGTVALLSDFFFRISFGKKNNDNKNNLGAILAILGIILIILSPLIAKIIQLAISRKREYLADADGALLTRYPAGLANALEKISKYHEPMRRVNTATAHLYIANPFFNQKKRFSNLFSTHPPIEDRIAKLRSMA